MGLTLNRREFLTLASASVAASARLAYSQEQEPITAPVVSEDACPLVPIAPVAKDGFRGQGFLRKPPGDGPFPAILWIHPGLVRFQAATLLDIAGAPNPSRFLAAGYVVVVPTYRSRDVDPQSTVSLQDSVAAVEYTRALPYVDPQSIVVYGCSGGGDLALEVAAATSVCAVVPEEPASLLMAGIFNTKFPKQGERYSAQDAGPIMENPREYYTAEYQQVMRAKVARIRCPILIVQGDEERREIPINRFNAQVLIPELRAAGKVLEVITYPGQPHCFCFTGARNQLGRVPGGPPDPRAALKASGDIDAFCQRYLKTKPKPLSSNLVRRVTL